MEETDTIWPATSATRVVSVRGITEPWEKTEKFKEIIFAGMASTRIAWLAVSLRSGCFPLAIETMIATATIDIPISARGRMYLKNLRMPGLSPINRHRGDTLSDNR